MPQLESFLCSLTGFFYSFMGFYMKKWIVRVHDNTTGVLVAVDFVNTREHARRVKNQYKSTFRLNKVTIGKAIVNNEGALFANSKVYY